MAVLIRWEDNAINEIGYEIERSIDGNTWNLLIITEPNVTEYIDTSILLPGTQYYYQVTTLCTSCNSVPIIIPFLTDNTQLAIVSNPVLMSLNSYDSIVQLGVVIESDFATLSLTGFD